jgi:molybdate transport system substrate-binding protein
MLCRLRLIVVLLVTLGLAAACGSDGPGRTGGERSPSGTITVSAAASLTEAFGRIGEDFHAASPGVTVTFNFGSSGTLGTQIQQGAPADAFASADEDTMDELVTAGLISGKPRVFARNELVIVTKPGNPRGVRSLADLAKLDVVSLCGITVPCGKYAAQVLEDAGVTIPETKVSRGQDVKATLTAVTTGDADAAIVYVTDAKAAGEKADTVAIPDEQNAIATYPIAVMKESDDRAASDAFVAYVLSSEGAATLRSFGFLPPS